MKNVSTFPDLHEDSREREAASVAGWRHIFKGLRRTTRSDPLSLSVSREVPRPPDRDRDSLSSHVKEHRKRSRSYRGSNNGPTVTALGPAFLWMTSGRANHGSTLSRSLLDGPTRKPCVNQLNTSKVFIYPARCSATESLHQWRWLSNGGHEKDGSLF